MINHYLVLGIEPDAHDLDIEKAFVRLRQSLTGQDFERESKHWSQAKACLNAFENAYAVLSNSQKREDFDKAIKSQAEALGQSSQKPRLGQLCVASGILTVEQLERCVEDQLQTGLPLGEVMENNGLISGAELEGILLGQDLIDLEDISSLPLARRILALDLVTEDMLLIAHMETKAQGVSLENALVRRDWISEQLMEILK